MGCDLTCNMLKTMCSTSTDMLVSKKANKMNWEGVTRPSSTPIVISTTAQLLSADIILQNVQFLVAENVFI